ncbi:MAG: hypothetical protein QW416_06200 [Candidatus Nitrosocaldaceae archaeon]
MNEIILGGIYIITALITVYLTLNKRMKNERFVKTLISLFIIILMGLYIPPSSMNMKHKLLYRIRNIIRENFYINNKV